MVAYAITYMAIGVWVWVAPPCHMIHLASCAAELGRLHDWTLSSVNRVAKRYSTQPTSFDQYPAPSLDASSLVEYSTNCIDEGVCMFMLPYYAKP